MLDLPERSVVVGGLDNWDMHVPGAFQTIEEPRLSQLLFQRLRADARLRVDRPPELRTPPLDPNLPFGRRPPAIESPIFPQWFVCEAIGNDEPGKRRLVRFSDLQPPKRKECVGDDGKRRQVTPVRFLCGCTNGHLQDIEWRRILHSDVPACQQPMWLEDTSTSADPRDTRIVCDCGRSLTLEELFQPRRLGFCQGERPWIGERDPAPCDAPKGLSLLTRSATNTYFPQVVTVISLPQAEDLLARRIEEHWSALQKATNAAWIDIAREANPAIGAALEGFQSDDILARIKTMGSAMAAGEQAQDPRVAEFDLFSSGRALIGENSATAHLLLAPV
jgi:hypothetical protein